MIPMNKLLRKGSNMNARKLFTGGIVGFLFMAVNASAADCIQGPKKNCMDLCRSDPGNSLNTKIESTEKLNEFRDGSCKLYDHGEVYSGTRITTIDRVTYFEDCADLRTVKIEKNS